MTLTERLKQAVAAAHERIEATPLSRAMLGGRLDRDTYLALLGDLEAVHGPLEAHLGRHADSLPIFQPSMARAGVLRRDRRALGDGRADPYPSTAARGLLERVAFWADSAPLALAGVLYVFEGSRMGSLVLAGRLAAALGVAPQPGQGLDYHLDGAPDRPRLWRQFKAALDALPLTDDQRDGVVHAAGETMDRLCEVYAALLPSDAAAAGAPA